VETKKRLNSIRATLADDPSPEENDRARIEGNPAGAPLVKTTLFFIQANSLQGATGLRFAGAMNTSEPFSGGIPGLEPKNNAASHQEQAPHAKRAGRLAIPLSSLSEFSLRVSLFNLLTIN
jgi:hypothetical protein